jgi:hypothetical protein
MFADRRFRIAERSRLKMSLLPQEIIRRGLERTGWEVIGEITTDLDWWADEVWMIRSLWSPQDCVAYITFLVDPMWEGKRRKGEGVWAAKVTASPATTSVPEPNEAQLRVGKWTATDLDDFLEQLARLRRLWTLRTEAERPNSPSADLHPGLDHVQ